MNNRRLCWWTRVLSYSRWGARLSRDQSMIEMTRLAVRALTTHLHPEIHKRYLTRIIKCPASVKIFHFPYKRLIINFLSDYKACAKQWIPSGFALVKLYSCRIERIVFTILCTRFISSSSIASLHGRCKKNNSKLAAPDVTKIDCCKSDYFPY